MRSTSKNSTAVMTRKINSCLLALLIFAALYTSLFFYMRMTSHVTFLRVTSSGEDLMDVAKIHHFSDEAASNRLLYITFSPLFWWHDYGLKTFEDNEVTLKRGRAVYIYDVPLTLPARWLAY